MNDELQSSTLPNISEPVPSVEEIKRGLETTEKGGVKQNIRNCITVFENDPLIRGAIWHNCLTGMQDIVKPLGWERSSSSLTDTDLNYLMLYLEDNYSLTNEKKILSAIKIVANENQYHPIRDYLNALEWDGTERIRYVLNKYLGADIEEYTYEALKLFMLGAISRVFHPGCKYEFMLCLVGGQGAGKSTFFRLLAISDGRKLGLDQRVINPDLPDDPTSKVNQCVDNIYRIWDEGQPEKLTQLLFCDLSTPKTTAVKKVAKAVAGNLDSPELHALEQLTEDAAPEQAFTIYDDIRDKLVAKGIPRDQIAYIHEANTEVRKKELFAKVRSGHVRVLMGSTFKMGAGMNVQDRLVALHDLDAPWRPGDLEQRSGRIIRQGNKNKEVHIYRYVTEATFDAYLWQTLENKQKFISQIMTSKSPVRSCEDIDETSLSYAEIKALCAGDERIKEKMDLDVDVARLKIMKASHNSQQYKLEDNMLRYFPEQVEQNKGFIAGFDADMKTLAEHPHPKDGFAGMEVKGDRLTDKDNAGAAILEAFKDAKGLEPVAIGRYRGFAMSLTVENFGKDYVLTLKGQMTHRVTLGKDAKGNLVRIDNALNGMAERKQNVDAKLANLYSQMETAKAEIGKPFPQEDELRTKSARLAELNTELNIDDKTPLERLAEPETEIAKSARPSVLAQLKRPLPPPTQGKKKNKDMEL